MSVDENEPFDGLETSFIERFGCSQNLESLFSDLINDSEFPTTVTHDAQSVLKGIVDDAFRMADDVGEEGVKKLESMLKKFNHGVIKNAENNNKGKDNFDICL